MCKKKEALALLEDGKIVQSLSQRGSNKLLKYSLCNGRSKQLFTVYIVKIQCSPHVMAVVKCIC